MLLCACALHPAYALDDPQPAIASPQAEDRLLVSLERIGDRIVAVGVNGHIVLSDDDGASWRHASVPVSLMITAIDAADAQTLWAVGHEGIVLKSEDRGENWSIALDGQRIAALQLASARERYAAQQARLDALDADTPALEDLQYALEETGFEIEDLEALAGDGIVTPLLGVTFVDENTGFIVGAYGLMLATSDGGAQWSLMSSRLDNPDNKHLYALVRTRAGTLIAAGEAGALFRSTDNGETWQTVDAGYQGSLFGLLATADGSLLAYGLRGRIFRSTDEGESFSAVANGNRATLLGGSQLGDGSIVLVGAGGAILVSRDDGSSFSALETETRNSISDVIAASSGGLIVAGFDGVGKIDMRLPAAGA